MDVGKVKTKKKDVRDMILHKPTPDSLKNIPCVELDDNLDFCSLFSTINYAEYYRQHGRRKLAEHLVKILSSLFNVPEWYFTIIGEDYIKSKPLPEFDVYINRDNLLALSSIFPINYALSHTKFGETILHIRISQNWETEIENKMRNIISEYTFF